MAVAAGFSRRRVIAYRNTHHNHGSNYVQVNTLMMALQFSYAPFHYDQETMDISRAMLKLREKWLPYMLETIDKSLEIKEPPFR